MVLLNAWLTGRSMRFIKMNLNPKNSIRGFALLLISILLIFSENEEAIGLIKGLEDKSEESYIKGVTFYATGEYEKAIPYLKEAAEKNPSNEKVLFFFGLLLQRTK